MNMEIIQEICKYILEHLNEQITLEELESKFYYNKRYIIKSFKEYTGFTIIEFINTCRILNTIYPLLNTDRLILNIGLLNGFNSLKYFSETFRNVIGTSPYKFKKYYIEVLNSEDINEILYLKEYINSIYEYQTVLNNFPKEIYEVKKLQKVNIVEFSSNSN